MTGMRVRWDHLAHYVGQLPVSGAEKSELLEQLRGEKVIQRRHVFDTVAKHFPAAREYLLRAWTAYGRQSVFLWEAPVLKSFTTEQMMARIAESVRRSKKTFRTEDLPEWTRLEVGDDSERRTRMLKIRMSGNEIGAAVRLTKTHRYVFEDAERRSHFQYDVVLTASLSGHQLLKVYGAQLDGKKTVVTFLEWLLGESLPERRPQLNGFVKPVTFLERDVKALGATLKGQGGVEGPDPKDRLGKVVLEGKTSGFWLEELDPKDARVKDQEPAPQSVRKYNFQFQHPDGFFEKSRVDFTGLGGRHPHLNFPVRTSLPAMDYMINMLYSALVPKP